MQRLARWNETENDSRLLKNSEGNRDGEWNFYRGKEGDIALFLQVTRMRKIPKKNLRSQLVDDYPKLDGHNQRT